MFRDRRHVATALATRLAAYRKQIPLVFGIPWGAVPVASALAETLDGDLDVVVVGEVELPASEARRRGLVDEHGALFLPPRDGARPEVDEHVRRELGRVTRQRNACTSIRQPLDARGRVAVVVDDGAAPARTMVAVIESVRRRGATWVVAAVPVASAEAGRLIRAHADETVILHERDALDAPSSLYQDRDDVTEDEVLQLLSRASMGA